ncbi:hypothetical protein CI610_00722 [invertebrate metagenome]|uniref:Uncharacterized protein n=1 Tax=invertebrate metagenome TaxID=1711999 RepID=A0A2H9TAK9_9ZZZZ
MVHTTSDVDVQLPDLVAQLESASMDTGAFYLKGYELASAVKLKEFQKLCHCFFIRFR